MKHRILCMVLVLLLIVSCEKDRNVETNGKVELYLIESFSKVENGYCQIDESTIITEESPFLNYSDFLSYDPGAYEFELSKSARNRINGMSLSTNGVAFALKVDGVFIYSGYFWPGYSSASCNWVVIDPILNYTGNKIKVQLGYPGPLEGETIPDRRNDERIVNVFRRDNKLN